MNYSDLLDLYTELNKNGLPVTSFNSDTISIMFKNTTTNEALIIKKMLNATGYNVTIELLDSLLYNFHFHA